MPELPDVSIYIEALERFLTGRTIQNILVKSPFLVRTFEPDYEQAIHRKVVAFRRLGKRIVWELEGELYLVFHLMIAGRFQWKDAGTKPTGKIDLAAFQFEHGVLVLTEAGSKKRASLHIVQGEAGLEEHRRDGLEVLGCTLPEFKTALLSENHTVKRSLTDPRLFSGIGNAYSDEILHAAQLSPIKWTSRLTDDEMSRLYEAVQTTLHNWIERTREEVGDGFPKKVTAFRKQMAVHGKFNEPCPTCGVKVARIVYADNETNYCPKCQTNGKLLADRSLSRLLKDDWPRTIEE